MNVNRESHIDSGEFFLWNTAQNSNKITLCLPSCERKPYISYHNFRTVDVAFPQLVTGQIRNQTRVLGYFELGVTVTPSHFIIRNN